MAHGHIVQWGYVGQTEKTKDDETCFFFYIGQKFINIAAALEKGLGAAGRQYIT